MTDQVSNWLFNFGFNSWHMFDRIVQHTRTDTGFAHLKDVRTKELDDAMEAMELIASGAVPVARMTTHRLPLEQAQEGFRLTAAAGDSKGDAPSMPRG